MTDILLVTLNATYQHTAFGLRYLLANLEELKDRAEILEFTIERDPKDIVAAILEKKPRIIGFGVYIWNTTETEILISMIKKISPETLIVIGGPEVSHQSESQSICQKADHIIKGEADFLFRDFCRQVLLEGSKPVKFISGPLPEIEKIQSPYLLYSENDIKNRYIYVEASRGCPYKCEYCLSSLDKSVRNFPLDTFLQDLQTLIEKGARQFKFIDRTFNLSPSISSAILKFFLDRMHFGLFLHFEMVPDRLPLELQSLLTQFPPGSLQFEVGIQTLNSEVASHVSRKNNMTKVKENFQFLTEKTSVHIHADLIAGLPGETLTSFAKGFDELLEMNPHEIQVGILKRLKGTPIIRHDQVFGMVYSDTPPFEILRTNHMSFSDLRLVEKFSKFWDLIANSGHFKVSLQFLKSRWKTQDLSFFWSFQELVGFLSERHPLSRGISLLKLTESLFLFLVERLNVDKEKARDLLFEDYCTRGQREIPGFLRPNFKANLNKPASDLVPQNSVHSSVHNRRQRAHLPGS